MSENITIVGDSKEEKYVSLLPQVKSLIGAENDLIANMANVSAALKQGLIFYGLVFI